MVRINTHEQMDMIRHDDIFATSNALSGLADHEPDKVLMEFVCCENASTLMRTNGYEVEWRIVLSEDGLQMRGSAWNLVFHAGRLAPTYVLTKPFLHTARSIGMEARATPCEFI